MSRLINPGAIVLAISSLLCLAVLGGSFSAASGATGSPKPVPRRIWFSVILVLLMFGLGCTLTLKPTAEQVKSALGVFLVLSAGIFAKWLSEAAARNVWALDASLVAAFVVSPIVILAAWPTFSSAPTLHSLLLCFSNGFFWQAIFADFRRRNRSGAARKPLKPAAETGGGQS
jgi:hypothetical protein